MNLNRRDAVSTLDVLGFLLVSLQNRNLSEYTL